MGCWMGLYRMGFLGRFVQDRLLEWFVPVWLVGGFGLHMLVGGSVLDVLVGGSVVSGWVGASELYALVNGSLLGG